MTVHAMSFQRFSESWTACGPRPKERVSCLTARRIAIVRGKRHVPLLRMWACRQVLLNAGLDVLGD